MLLQPESAEERKLYQAWQGLSADSHVDAHHSHPLDLPPIVVSHILREIGVPVLDREDVASKLGSHPCESLLKAAVAAGAARSTLLDSLAGIGVQIPKQAFVR